MRLIIDLLTFKKKLDLIGFAKVAIFNWEFNLVMDGLLLGSFPDNNCSALHAKKKINLESRYLMFKFLLANVN